MNKMNNLTESFNFSNTQLYEHLRDFSQTLPQDAPWQTFKTLIEAVKFALLNGENPSRLSKRIRRERHRNEPHLIPLSGTKAQLDIAEIKRLRQLAKDKPLIPGSRKLDSYRQEIATLRQQGASQMDIKYWLIATYGVTVSQSTIHRYLNMLSHGQEP